MSKMSNVIKIDDLPVIVRREALDYVEFLKKKYGKKEKRSRLKFDWEGGLSELKVEFTSVELQHKASEWR